MTYWVETILGENGWAWIALGFSVWVFGSIGLSWLIGSMVAIGNGDL